MKYLSLICACCLSFLPYLPAQEDFRKTAPEPGPAPEINLGDYETFQLDNGLTVIVVEDHKLPRVSFQVFVDVPLHREGELAGLGSLAGELISAGTERRSKAEIDEAVDFIGASLSSSSNGVFGSSLSKHRETLLEIMSEVLLQPAFPAEEFDKLKTQSLSGLAAVESNPDAMASNLAQVLRYGPQHPYGEIATRETIEALELGAARDYYHQYFRPNISYLVMVGDLNVGEARSLANTYFGAWERAEVPEAEYDLPRPPARAKVSVVDRPSSVQSVLRLTYPVSYQPGQQNAQAASIMDDILGQGSNGRLFLNVREDKGYTYGISSNLSSDEYVGFFNIGASVRNEVTDSALTEILNEMERIRTQPVSEGELRRARMLRNGTFARSLESPQTLANFALNTIRYELPEDYYPTYLERLATLSQDDILEAARTYIKPEQVHIVVVGNYEEIKEKLLPFDDDGLIERYDAFGRPLAEPEEAPANVNGEQVIRDYLQAIGGAEKLRTVESLMTRMSASVQGQPIEMTIYQEAPNKVATRISAGGMVVQEDKYDGERGVRMAMGQKQELQGRDLDDLADQAIPFPEMKYLEDGYSVEVKGATEVNGQRAYQVVVTTPDNDNITEYYAVDSKLKLRTTQVQERQGQTATVSSELGDYKEVEGILWPHNIAISGVMPFPLEMSVQEIEVNPEIEEEVFRIE